MTKRNSTFHVPTRVVAGIGSLDALSDAILSFGVTTVGVVADRGVAEAGVLDQVTDVLPDGIAVTTMHIDPDPGVAATEQSCRTAREAGIELVVGVGGGSALGVAKAVALRLRNEKTIDAYEVGADPISHAPVPSIAIPTTAGSGSEVSRTLVLHEPGRSRELIVTDERLAPNLAFLDGRLLRSLPVRPLTYAALDALSHAMESLWSRNSSFATEALAMSAARTIVAKLPAALAGVGDLNGSGDNDEVLQDLLEASCAANLACGNSGLTLVHSLSSAIGIHVEHGHQNGILLPAVARFNAAEVRPEVAALAADITPMYEQIGFRPEFRHGTIPDGAAEMMIEAAASHPARHNNLKLATDDDLRTLLATVGAH
ncbi:iron-containing alcohol dehydrogenase [Nocardioides sp. 1609]|uniref:iron-containing alcohol dehydrogenase n=1 Tax=Nocardioides sp. 1609 TaxID=2508327 RepID=UPI001070484A|nr:iron-containing alcohol dehydrogenase [Nocardioides sp. 1609]